jgi:hypothetical protein
MVKYKVYNMDLESKIHLINHAKTMHKIVL